MKQFLIKVWKIIEPVLLSIINILTAGLLKLVKDKIDYNKTKENPQFTITYSTFKEYRKGQKYLKKKNKNKEG